MRLTMDHEEIMKLMDQFINEKGLWQKFKAFLKTRGLKPEDLGMFDDTDPLEQPTT